MSRFPISALLKNKFWWWIAKRSPKAPKVTLRHKSIYVLPTSQGLLFLLVVMVMWLLGTNYQNNLILATVFLLVSLMIVSILHAFKNLLGLQFEVVASRSTFAGAHAEFVVLITSAVKNKHDNIHVALDLAFPVTVDLIEAKEQRVTLVAHAPVRGWFSPGRILVKSYYPLGLVRAWSWVHLDMSALVYPAPIACEEPPLTQLSDHAGAIVARENHEDFYGLASYQAGMPMARVAWKQYARGAGLHLKDYVGYQSQDVWLDWQMLKGLDTEARLSRLCYWVLQLSKTSGQYGLRLPHQSFELGAGDAHKVTLLRALALYSDGQKRNLGDHHG